jgi:hypothetical protein
MLNFFRKNINLDIITKMSLVGHGIYNNDYKLLLMVGSCRIFEYLIDKYLNLPMSNTINNLVLLNNTNLNILYKLNLATAISYFSSIALLNGIKYVFRTKLETVVKMYEFCENSYSDNKIEINEFFTKHNIVDILNNLSVLLEKTGKIMMNNSNEIVDVIKTLQNNQIVNLEIGDFKINSKYIIQNTPNNVEKLSPVYSKATPYTASHFIESNCQICFDNYNEQRQLYRVLPCGHSYHVNCIDEWFQLPTHKNCPTCRADFSELL